MKLSISVFLLFTFLRLQSQEVINTSFTSASLDGTQIPLNIYLPAGYSESNQPYRLYIFMHGCCGLNQNSHINSFKSRLDQKIASGEIDPIVVAFPSAQGADFENLHLWIDSERNGNYGSLIVNDLTGWLESNYNVTTTKEKRAIGGFSMGALGSFQLGLNFSDQFIALVSHSGYSAIENFENWVPEIIAETGQSNPPYTYSPANGSNTNAIFGISSAYSPNLNNPPHLLDFPIDENGEIIQEVLDRWRYIASPDSIIRRKWGTEPKIVPVAMYFDVGIQESVFTFYQTNVFLNTQLENLDLNQGFDMEYVFNVFNEGHNMSIQRIDSSLVWLDRIMDAATITSTAIPVEKEAAFSVFPNIVDKYTELVFHQNLPENSTLLVCNSVGKIIFENKDLIPATGGTFKIATDQWPAGVYWIYLNTGKEIFKKQVIKM